MAEPKCRSVVCSASTGGKVTIVKFDLTADYHFLMSRTYDIPDDWTEEQVREFQSGKTQEIKDEVDLVVQPEYEALLEQSERFRGGRHVG